VAPPGNQAATEKTNINLYHSENPVYSPKVGRHKITQSTESIASLKSIGQTMEVKRRWDGVKMGPEAMEVKR